MTLTPDSVQVWEYWMRRGDFDRAWREGDCLGGLQYELDSLKSKRVLIRCLRGLGDAIQFLRYTTELRTHCRWLAVQAPSRLYPLLSHFADIDEVYFIGDCVDADWEIECSDLPYLFRTTVSTIPASVPYIHGIPPLWRRLSHKLMMHRRELNVGLVWTAGAWNPKRSVPLESFHPLLGIPGIAWFSLQRGDAVSKTSYAVESICMLEEENGTILDTAAAIDHLDLIISVDTMVAHLAGALGKPVWTLLPYEADWRWMVNRSDSLWYPTMRLFRQSEPGCWGNVIGDVGTELTQVVDREFQSQETLCMSS